LEVPVGGGAVGELMDNVNCVVLARDPETEVTFTLWFPVGVVDWVEIFNVVEQFGLQEVCEKVPVAPEGRPDTEKVAAWVLPEMSVAVMLFEVDWP
jgi:hypothetical protein